MADLISIAPFLRRRRNRNFDKLVHDLRELPLSMLIEALTAAREVAELAYIAADFNALVISCTSAPPTAGSEGDQ